MEFVRYMIQDEKRACIQTNIKHNMKQLTINEREKKTWSYLN